MNATWLNKLPTLNYSANKLHETSLGRLSRPVFHQPFQPGKGAQKSAKRVSSLQFAWHGNFLNDATFPLVVGKRKYSDKKGPTPTDTRIRRPTLAEDLVRTTDDPLYDTTQVPSFREYFIKSHTQKASAFSQEQNAHVGQRTQVSEDITGPRLFAYVMVGAAGMLTSVAAKNSVINLLSTLAPTSRVVASGRIEVNLADIPEARNMVVKWRGKPVFIRHRTDAEIEEAETVDWKKLRDPESDAERTKNPKWLIMVGICTHLGCVPIGEAGDYGGWYCPCHGSHYDISGRIRRGPAPLNMEIPPYEFIEDTRVAIG